MSRSQVGRVEPVPPVTHCWALSLWKRSSWQGGHGGQWSCEPGPCLSYRQKRGRSVGLPEARTPVVSQGPGPHSLLHRCSEEGDLNLGGRS